MIKFKPIHLFYILILVILVAFILFYGFKILMDISYSDKNWAESFVAALGNILGGIIGGIVAFIVARHQIQQTLDAEKEKQNTTSNTMLKFIREELLDNVSYLEKVDINNSHDFKLLKTQLSDDNWKSTMFHLSIDDDLVVKLNVCYKKISLIKSLEIGEFDQEFISEVKQQLEITIELLKQKIPE